MKITVLAENTALPGFSGEHGLSLFIETSGKKILFDAGQTGLFAQNAEKLGIDLESVDFCVLSHGHYDHGDGLERFMELNKTAPVYLNKNAFIPHYGTNNVYIGLDIKLKQSDRLVYTDGVTEIEKGITLYTCNEREKRVEPGTFNLTALVGGEYLPDDFCHEHYLLIEENGKKILFSGCSHKGVINIAEWFHPDYLIGGFHFWKIEPSAQLEDFAKQLDGFDTRFYTCHCTGGEQYEFMKKTMRNLSYVSTGMTVTI